MRISRPLLVIAFVLLLSGCAAPSKTGQVKAKWNATRAAVLHSLAEDQFETGNFDKSRKTVNDGLALDPQNVPLRLLSAKLAMEQGKMELAAAELKLIRELVPTNAEADYLTGVIYQRWQQPQTALEHYTAANEKAPAELAYLLARAEMLVALDRDDEALAMLQEKVIYYEHSAAIREAVGLLLFRQGKYRDAADSLRQAAILDGENMGTRQHLALALFHNRQYREAADALTKVLASDAYAERADLLTALGECQNQLGRYRDARATLEKASQFDSASPGLWLALSKATLQLNDYKRAELAIRKALSLDPDNADAHLLLGYLRLRQDRLDDAFTAFQKASRLNGQDTVSLCMAGYVLERSGRQAEALEYYGLALKLKPSDELAARLMAGADLSE